MHMRRVSRARARTHAQAHRRFYLTTHPTTTQLELLAHSKWHARWMHLYSRRGATDACANQWVRFHRALARSALHTHAHTILPAAPVNSCTVLLLTFAHLSLVHHCVSRCLLRLEVFTTLQCIHSWSSDSSIARIGTPFVIALPTASLSSLRMLDIRRVIKAAVGPWLNGGRGWQEGIDSDVHLYRIVLMDRATENVILDLPYTDGTGTEDYTVNISEETTKYHSATKSGTIGMSFALRWLGTEHSVFSKLLRESSELNYPSHIARIQADSNIAGVKRTSIDLADCLTAFAKVETLRRTEAWYCSTCKAHKEATKVHTNKYEGYTAWRSLL
jgi:hypothetical protein